MPSTDTTKTTKTTKTRSRTGSHEAATPKPRPRSRSSAGTGNDNVPSPLVREGNARDRATMDAAQQRELDPLPDVDQASAPRS